MDCLKITRTKLRRLLNKTEYEEPLEELIERYFTEKIKNKGLGLELDYPKFMTFFAAEKYDLLYRFIAHINRYCVANDDYETGKWRLEWYLGPCSVAIVSHKL